MITYVLYIEYIDIKQCLFAEFWKKWWWKNQIFNFQIIQKVCNILFKMKNSDIYSLY